MSTDPTAPAEIIGTGTTLYAVADPQLGDLVVVHKQGRYRRARIVRMGRTRVMVAWGTGTTPRHEQRVSLETLYTTNDGGTDGGEVIGVVTANSSKAYYGENASGQHIEAVAETDISLTRPAGSIYDRIAEVADVTSTEAEHACEALRRGAGLAVQTYADEKLVAKALVALELLPAPTKPFSLFEALAAGVEMEQDFDRECRGRSRMIG